MKIITVVLLVLLMVGCSNDDMATIIFTKQSVKENTKIDKLLGITCNTAYNAYECSATKRMKTTLKGGSINLLTYSRYISIIESTGEVCFYRHYLAASKEYSFCLMQEDLNPEGMKTIKDIASAYKKILD